MTDKEFVLTAFLEDFMKVAKVNIDTGEYRFIKKLETEAEKRCLQAATIDGYIRNIVENHLLHPDDVQLYQQYTDLKYLRDKIAMQKRRMVHSFRRRIGNEYVWLTFEIIVPKKFSPENPWVVFSWKEADSDVQVMEDAMGMLSAIFCKILRINLTEDTYEPIKVSGEEMEADQGFSPQISRWLRRFAECGNVHPEDREAYLSFIEQGHMSDHFRKSRKAMRCRYRRRTGNSFRWVTMMLLPSVEYSDTDQIVMLYVQDIHDSYVAKLQHQKELEYYCNYDTLTGLRNRYCYDTMCAAYRNGEKRFPVALAFADLNRLKYINDHFGHAMGDEHIRSFAQLLREGFGDDFCYRVSGDEFMVVIQRIEEEAFSRKAQAFRERLQQQKDPVASIGFAWQEAPERIEDMLAQAEAEMYREKQEYYSRYPQYAR